LITVFKWKTNCNLNSFLGFPNGIFLFSNGKIPFQNRKSDDNRDPLRKGTRANGFEMEFYHFKMVIIPLQNSTYRFENGIRSVPKRSWGLENRNTPFLNGRLPFQNGRFDDNRDPDTVLKWEPPF
jgi:hypothetical protein